MYRMVRSRQVISRCSLEPECRRNNVVHTGHWLMLCVMLKEFSNGRLLYWLPLIGFCYNRNRRKGYRGGFDLFKRKSVRTYLHVRLVLH